MLSTAHGVSMEGATYAQYCSWNEHDKNKVETSSI